MKRFFQFRRSGAKSAKWLSAKFKSKQKVEGIQEATSSRSKIILSLSGLLGARVERTESDDNRITSDYNWLKSKTAQKF